MGFQHCPDGPSDVQKPDFVRQKLRNGGFVRTIEDSPAGAASADHLEAEVQSLKRHPVRLFEVKTGQGAPIEFLRRPGEPLGI